MKLYEKEKLEKYKGLKMPPSQLFTHPPKDIIHEVADPGFFWYWECAIGTNPAVFRLQQEGLCQCYGNFLHDRVRSGYIHNGFGPGPTQMYELIKAGLPWVHVHIHSMFATLEGTTADGETTLIIDKGHLTALDDTEVRALASKFGDPDKLLSEAWTPAVPGINAPGDYFKDYAQNPIPWIQKEAQEHPLWLD